MKKSTPSSSQRSLGKLSDVALNSSRTFFTVGNEKNEMSGLAGGASTSNEKCPKDERVFS